MMAKKSTKKKVVKKSAKASKSTKAKKVVKKSKRVVKKAAPKREKSLFDQFMNLFK